MPTQFSASWLTELDNLEQQWHYGDACTQQSIDEELLRWRQRLNRPSVPNEEFFDIVDEHGALLGLTAPRWFAHLTGLRHRVVHVLLRTPQGLLVTQMRSHTKAEWPDLLDTTVGGHLKAGQDWQAGVLDEIHEEIGLAPDMMPHWLAEPWLIPVGGPVMRSGKSHSTPPIRNWQVNQIYTGTLTPWGLAHIHFADGELDGIYLCAPDEIQRLIEASSQRLAPGLRNVFPIWQAFVNR
jgi:isopentenyldiphosphate isomerase